MPRWLMSPELMRSSEESYELGLSCVSYIPCKIVLEFSTYWRHAVAKIDSDNAL